MIISDTVPDCICLELMTMPTVTFILTLSPYTEITVDSSLFRSRNKQAADDSCVSGVFKRYKYKTRIAVI